MADVTLRKVVKRYDEVEAVRGIDLDIADHEFVVLVGPSGCGKSTTLRMIAGLEDISDGDIMIGGDVVNDVPPKDRDIAMVFQNYALYPHMTVAENMSFGLRLKRYPKAEIKSRIDEAARMLDIVELVDRKPKQLSGGQRQRVAMGRAIVRNPKVFLFDEPLSNLDAKLRVQMRIEIKKVHQKVRTTTVYVTHDQVEAMTLADRVVNDLAPKDRDVAMVFQSYALYPHMSVYDNLAFGLRNTGVPKREIDDRVRRAAEILQMNELVKRKPKQLSGGQRQRVALGRAIVREPKAFLMDEPLSNLDAKLRVETRAEILKLVDRLDTTTIYVTHDQVEAMTMGDRIAVMNAGVLQQVGTPAEVYTNPRNVFVAGFIGSPAMNLVPAPLVDAGGPDRIAGFRPEHLRLGQDGANAYTFDARVEVVEYLGDEQLVHLLRKDTPLLAKLPVEQRIETGRDEQFAVARDKVVLFDAETQERVG